LSENKEMAVLFCFWLNYKDIGENIFYLLENLTLNIKRISYRKDINSLRAIAVLVVVFYHAEVLFFNGGWLGVDIFFVISGYLISNIIISELNDGTFTFKNFYLRRVKRILPPLFAILLFSLPFSFWLLTPKAMYEYLYSGLASLTFISNYYFVNFDFYNAEPSKFIPLLHTWSLSIEEQYYIIFPAVLFVINKFFKKYLLHIIGVTIFLSLGINLLVQSNFSFYRIEFRVWELLIGTVIMILNSKWHFPKLNLLGYFFLFFPIFMFDDSSLFNLLPRVICLAGVAIVLISENEKSITTKLFSLKPFQTVGLISYSMYLIHQPLFAFSRVFVYKNFPNFYNLEYPEYFGDLYFKRYTLPLLIILFLLSLFSYFFIEKKFIQEKINLKWLIPVFLTLSTIYIVGINDSGFISRYDETRFEIIENADNRSNTLKLNNLSCFERKLDQLCNWDYGFDEDLVLFGDSHAHTLSLFLYQESKNLGKNYLDVTGCIKYIEKNPINDECQERGLLPSEYFAYLTSIKNSTIIYSLNPFMEIEKLAPEVFSNYLEKTVKILLKNGNEVLIINPIPEFPYNIPDQYIYGNLELSEPALMNYDDYLQRSDLIQINNIYDNLANLSISQVFPEKIFCNSYVKNNCVGSYNQNIFYYDDNHLTREGALVVGEKIIELLK
jgi:peptidoglycan/LPS O-acetylase OafA/YrhL